MTLLNRWMTVADPIHGIIRLDREEKSHRLLLDVMNSLPFQRLRRIKQMGMAEFVFPNATHSRFVHSIGATHLMIQALEHFRQMPNAKDLIAEHYPGTQIPMEWLLLLGILTHDIGHGALSHTLEDILDLHRQDLHHDSYWNVKILMEDPELLAIWEAYDPQIPEALLSFLGMNGRPRHFLSTLISSQLDMDRLDYLQRDSHFLGVKYGYIESARIINNLLIVQQPGEEPLVAVREEAVPAVEHYLFGRHQAYKMALHSLDKASEITLKKTVKRFFSVREQGIDTGDNAEALYLLMKDGRSLDIQDYLIIDDYYLWQAIGTWSRSTVDPLLQTLALRLMKHELFKFVDLVGYDFEGALTDIPEVYNDLQQHYEEQGLSWEYGFEELEVQTKPLYQQPPVKQPIWIWRKNRLVDLADVSSLPLLSTGKQGGKHLVFVWDREARRFLRQRLNEHFGVPMSEPALDNEGFNPVL